MYGWIWRKLPGGWLLKSLASVAMIAVIGGVLVVVVFPWVEPKLPFSGNTVSGDTESGDTSPAPAPTQPSTTDTDLPSPSTSDTGDDIIPGD